MFLCLARIRLIPILDLAGTRVNFTNCSTFAALAGMIIGLIAVAASDSLPQCCSYFFLKVSCDEVPLQEKIQPLMSPSWQAPENEGLCF